MNLNSIRIHIRKKNAANSKCTIVNKKDTCMTEFSNLLNVKKIHVGYMLKLVRNYYPGHHVSGPPVLSPSCCVRSGSIMENPQKMDSLETDTCENLQKMHGFFWKSQPGKIRRKCMDSLEKPGKIHRNCLGSLEKLGRSTENAWIP